LKLHEESIGKILQLTDIENNSLSTSPTDWGISQMGVLPIKNRFIYQRKDWPEGRKHTQNEGKPSENFIKGVTHNIERS
jgi:hypothetical protein